MKIGVLIDNITSLYCWQWMGHTDHEYIVYRDQLHQYSQDTTLAHYHSIMKQWLEYLVQQWVDHIICPPTIEIHFSPQYTQILPIFQSYVTHALQHSIVGKIWFVGSNTQCESINLHWWDITTIVGAPWLQCPLRVERTSVPLEGSYPKDWGFAPRQLSNRHFNPNFPIRTSIDTQLTHRLLDHKPDHPTSHQHIKQLLRPLKDAAVDTVIWLNRSYYACDVSRTHHTRSIKRHRTGVLQSLTERLLQPFLASWTYRVSIHHTGTLRDLQANKKIRRLLARGKTVDIQITHL